MTSFPYTEIHSSYENVEVICPICKVKNIFNRITDLQDTSPISFKKVDCQNKECGQSFNINCDSINPPFERMILDCRKLIEDKNYSNCIKNLTQAIEVFIYTFLKAELIYKLSDFKDEFLIENVNNLLLLLDKKIEKYSYSNLKSIFLKWFVDIDRPINYGDSKKLISRIDKFKSIHYNEKEIMRVKLNDIQPSKLSTLLISFYDLDIDKFRNRVIHKSAYRASLEEAMKYYKEVTDIIFPLRRILNIMSDELNDYL